MRVLLRLLSTLMVTCFTLILACLRPQGERVGKYIVVGTFTDDAQQDKCKANAETVLARHPDINCLVGLWAYNPPALLQVVKEAGKLGQVHIVAFDENEETLQGIKDGHIVGTIVQDPYNFGYQSMRILAATLRKQDLMLPEDRILYIPHRIITRDNVEEFHKQLRELKEKPAEPPKGDPKQRLFLAFISNNPHEFWTICERGVQKAAADFNLHCEFHRPARGTPEEQRAILETLMTRGVQGVAISPVDAANQAQFFDEIASKIPFIAADSDLPPGSKRLCYVGTNNVEAGRAAGRLVRQVLPQGGKVAIFVGRLDVQNAVERRQGVLEALSEP
ncbi:MAG: substrate-binding domain-containing protein [Gemmatales bacterium]|nr:substrate-binding domain-containing protein [Gemmatales bacterium]MDW7994550.1 substrate-binding domain-containing protein [Gemmatales bacterium]